MHSIGGRFSYLADEILYKRDHFPEKSNLQACELIAAVADKYFEDSGYIRERWGVRRPG